MKLLQEYFELQQKIYDHFGYQEDWAVIPLGDGSDQYWHLSQDDTGRGTVHVSDLPFTLELVAAGEHSSLSIYTQRHLPQWVYRADDYTMICVDTHTDGNKFLMVFDNAKELKEPGAEMLQAFKDWDRDTLL